MFENCSNDVTQNFTSPFNSFRNNSFEFSSDTALLDFPLQNWHLNDLKLRDRKNGRRRLQVVNYEDFNCSLFDISCPRVQMKSTKHLRFRFVKI